MAAIHQNIYQSLSLITIAEINRIVNPFTIYQETLFHILSRRFRHITLFSIFSMIQKYLEDWRSRASAISHALPPTSCPASQLHG